MKCLDRVTIQEYIDRELDDLHSGQIKVHLSECEKCQELYATALEDQKRIESLLSHLDDQEEPVTIPDPGTKTLKRSFTERIRTSVWLRIAAGIALIIGLFWLIRTWSPSDPPELSEADLVIQEMLRDIEPNKAWHNTQTVFVITDETGEVIQSFLSNSN